MVSSRRQSLAASASACLGTRTDLIHALRFDLAGLSPVDRGVNTFSPEGRLFQVEYALEAIKLGSATVGIATKEGVVLGVEKRVQSKLLESSPSRRSWRSTSISAPP